MFFQKHKTIIIPSLLFFYVLSWHFRGTFVALLWHCQGTLMVLSWHCRGTLVALSRHCRGTVEVLSWHSHGTVVALSWHCPGTVLALTWHCPGAVLVLWRLYEYMVALWGHSGGIVPAANFQSCSFKSIRQSLYLHYYFFTFRDSAINN